MRRHQILLMILSVILLVLLLSSSACMCGPFDQGVLLKVDNQTVLTITVLIDGVSQDDVPPGEIKTIGTLAIPPNPDAPWIPEKYLIEARTKDGEVIYSKEFTWQELHDMDWKIVIPPPTPSS